MTPVTAPVEEPIVATAGLLLLHIPPPRSVSVSVMPTHRCVLPAMLSGKEVTLTVVLMEHPSKV